MGSYESEWIGGGWDKPGNGEVSGLTHDPSGESKRARRRAEYGARVNTNANRKNGGGATWGRVSAEYLAGTQRMNPATESTVKTRDDYGTALPAQHMIKITDEDTVIRTKARTDAERRSLLEYR